MKPLRRLDDIRANTETVKKETEGPLEQILGGTY